MKKEDIRRDSEVTRVVDLYENRDRSKQAAATRRLADACFAKGDDSDGWMYAKEALELYRQQGDLRGEAAVLCEIALAHFVTGTFQEGVYIAEEGVRICREQGYRDQLAAILVAAGRARLDQEATGAAQDLSLNWQARVAAKEALAIYEDTGNLYGQMKALNTLALAFMAYGNVLEGRAKAKRAVELSQMCGDKAAEGANLLLVAQSRTHDNRDEAVRLANLAQKLLKDGGDKGALAELEEVLEQIREPGKQKKAEEERKGGTTLAENMADKMDLTMDMDFMKTRAVYFWGFVSRETRR